MAKFNPAPFAPDRYEVLRYWMIEREAMRKAKAAGKPQPWSKDPDMANTRWCNCRRMDDRVSVWLMNKWYRPMLMTPRDALLAALVARTFNKEVTLTHLGLPFKSWNRDKFQTKLEELSESGVAVFTSVYIINGNGRPGQKKIDFVCEGIDSAAQAMGSDRRAQKYIEPDSMERTASNIDEIKGVGSFMAGQVVADLRWLVHRDRWGDRMSWAPPGPGSSRGMRFILGEGMEVVHGRGHDLKPKVFTKYLRLLIDVVQKDPKLKPIFDDRALEAHDVQNVLCETSKLARIRAGGRAKNQYRPNPTPFADDLLGL